MDSNKDLNKTEEITVSFGSRIEEVEFNPNRDRIFTFLTMSDYDWMSYKLRGEIPLKGGRLMTVVFEYDGFVQSEMSVKIGEEEIRYEFSTEVFNEYLQKYLEAEIKCFHSTSAFYGGDLLLEFYKAVVENEFQKNINRFKNKKRQRS